jgi:hypothetical protein
VLTESEADCTKIQRLLLEEEPVLFPHCISSPSNCAASTKTIRNDQSITSSRKPRRASSHEALTRMAHGRNLFYRLSTSGLSLQPFNLPPRSNSAAFQRCYRPSADEDLVIWKNNCNRKARTGKYLGLSSDHQLFLSENGDQRTVGKARCLVCACS